MAPGFKHEKAIEIVREMLKEEFGNQEIYNLPKSNLRPDLIWQINTGRIDIDILVVEIGNTNAEKIPDYMKMPRIGEIRWYTKETILAGRWIKENETGIKFKSQLRRIRRLATYKVREAELSKEIKSLTDKLKYYQEISRGEMLALCPGCFQAFPLNFGKTLMWQLNNKNIVVCKNCESRFEARELEMAYFYLKKIRKS